MISSSGIKRGLAASAVSALAVAGLPLLATSANAAVGDSFTVTYTGPALNGGDEGAVVVIRALDTTINPALLKAVGTSGTTVGTEDTADQNVQVLSASGPVNDPANALFEFITVRVATTTTVTGGAATFRLFEDDGATAGTLEASEARQPVSISTAGPLASIEVTPTNQSTAEGIVSGTYTATLKDAVGRTTQLPSTDSIGIVDDAPVEVAETGVDTVAPADDSITSDEIVRGSDTFTADPGAAVPGTYNIALTDVTTPAITTTATLNVTAAAVLTAGEVDIVTGADSWDGFGGGNFGAPDTFVRVDQSSVRIDIDADPTDANSTVTLNLAGTGITFGGLATTTVSTVLDANGVGSLTITPDAGTIQQGDSIAITGSFPETLTFQRSAPTTIDGESATYFCQLDAACTVTAVVLDQFGDPVTTGEVEASRTGSNTDATPQRKPVGPDGTVDFTFTDVNAVNNGTDTVKFEYFVDQFDNTFDLTNSSTTIKYSPTGQGSNFVTSLDTLNTEAAGYDASDVTVIPLTDTVADNDGTPASDEFTALTVANGETGEAMTVSVDNGALILQPGETLLSQGSASITDTVAGGSLPGGYKVIGTNSGVVTATISSANRTETAQFTVTGQSDTTQARNVTVSGPAEVEHGTTQITYTAVVTDAFGNPVVGLPANQLNIQVTGPAQFQDGDAVSNAAGQLNLNVRVDSDAEGVVTIRVQGIGSQFGAAADRLTAASPTTDGLGLPVSSNITTATTTVKAAVTPPPPPVVRTPIVARLLGFNNGANADRLKVNAPSKARGAVVKLFKIRKDGSRKLLSVKTLNSFGNKKFKVADRNGGKFTKYIAVVKRTAVTKGDTTNKKSVR